MCGLFGFKTHEDMALDTEQRVLRAKAVTLLGLEMESRGSKASGVAGFSGTNVTVVKKSESIRKLIDVPEYTETVFASGTLIGHTRFPTIGENTDKNAHPFVKGKIVGAHNGHVTNYWQLDKDVDVDSEVIFKKLDEQSNNYPKVFPTLQGAFALTWIDTRFPSSLYLVTHTNPLFYMESKKLNTLFWCSEERPLSILKRVILDEENQVFFPEEDMVLRITGALSKKWKPVTFKEPVRYQAPAPDYFSGHHRSFDDEHHFDQGKKKDTSIEALPSATPSVIFSAFSKPKYIENCVLCNDKIYTSIDQRYIDESSAEIFCKPCGQEYNAQLTVGEKPLVLLFPGRVS